MSLSIAIDQLHSTGWSTLDTSGCGYDADGRPYPAMARVRREFAQAGFELDVQHIAEFNCFRARWREAGGSAFEGSVVSVVESEAAVFALAQLRRGLAAMAT